MDQEKLEFISVTQFVLLDKLSEETVSQWGVMNPQQMVEHVRNFFMVSIEEIPVSLLTPEEHLPKYKDFLYSNKAFRENTKAPESLLGNEPLPLTYASLAIAREKLQATVNSFLEYFATDPSRKTLHPVFGPLNFEEWVLLHYKHVTHHLKQFGLIPRENNISESTV